MAVRGASLRADRDGTSEIWAFHRACDRVACQTCAVDHDDFARLARERWQGDGTDDAFDEVMDIVDNDVESVPALLRALVDAAPDGALSFLGVTILEDLSSNAEFRDESDPAIDVLLKAGLSRNDVFEILSGPWPEYLERWDVRHRLDRLFTSAQLDALLDWDTRFNRRIEIDGDGVRLSDLSAWFSRSDPDASR